MTIMLIWRWDCPPSLNQYSSSIAKQFEPFSFHAPNSVPPPTVLWSQLWGRERLWLYLLVGRSHKLSLAGNRSQQSRTVVKWELENLFNRCVADKPDSQGRWGSWWWNILFYTWEWKWILYTNLITGTPLSMSGDSGRLRACPFTSSVWIWSILGLEENLII